MVRLKVTPRQIIEQFASFQFLMVRLKEKFPLEMAELVIISIPYGSIKSRYDGLSYQIGAQVDN